MRTARLAIVLAAFASTGACAGDKPASPPRSPTVVDAPPSPEAGPTGNTAEPPPRQPDEASCDAEGLPPRDMIATNVVDTEMSGLGEITSAKITATDGSEPAPTSGYVHFVYEVDVVQQFTGERLEHVRLIQGAEAGAKTQRPGTLFFFSACIDGNGNAFEPDVGYFFPVDSACGKQMAEIAASAAKNLSDMKSRGSACRSD